jgi:hypothetical protein
MSGQRNNDKAGNADKAEQVELDRLGIVRVPADYFEWNGYRYTQARDAIAAAKRGAAR